MTASVLSSFAAPLMSSTSEKAVRQSPHCGSHNAVRRGQLNPAARTSVADQIVTFLRRRHPLKTADNVAVETGVPAGTVQKWLDRGSAPSADYIWRLVGAYGPNFLAIGFESAPEWIDRAAREEQAAQLKSEIAALEARLAGVRA